MCGAFFFARSAIPPAGPFCGCSEYLQIRGPGLRVWHGICSGILWGVVHLRRDVCCPRIASVVRNEVTSLLSNEEQTTDTILRIGESLLESATVNGWRRTYVFVSGTLLGGPRVTYSLTVLLHATSIAACLAVGSPRAAFGHVKTGLAQYLGTWALLRRTCRLSLLPHATSRLCARTVQQRSPH